MHLFENTTTRMKRPGAKYKHCEVVRKNFNNMFPLPPPTSPISISWQFASYVIFIHELGKHPHNVLEDEKRKKKNYLRRKAKVFPEAWSFSSDPFLFRQTRFQELVKMANIVRLIIYLLIYIFFLFPPPFNSISSRRHPSCPLGTSWVAKIS